MIYDGSDFLDKPPLETTVCIVGTGQAGITLAWYLVTQGIDVTLLEGSQPYDFDSLNDPVQNARFENQNEQLYNGEALGLFATNEPEFLIRPTPSLGGSPKERERIYGGTSTHWGGQSRPLDPITFEKRPVLSNCQGYPGWPITRDDLDPYYARACSFLDLYGSYYGPDGEPGYNFTAEFWAQELEQEVAQMDGFDVDMYQFVPEQNLQFQARKINGETIGENENARVIVNATLLDINEQNGNVSSLTVGVLKGDRNKPEPAGTFTVKAKAYVLACGAVANARQLLLSDVGNKSGFVGQYFMCHPIASNANAVWTDPSYLSTSEQALLSYQNPNTVYPRKSPQYSITFLAGLLTPTAEAARSLGTGRCWFGPGGTSDFYHEVLPEEASQITLADTADVFGKQETKIDWVFSPCAEANYKALTELFEAAVEAKGGGPVTIRPWNDILNRFVVNGHHLGTTRMSALPEDGVVDKNLKLHTVDNFYVAGSSVWASPGISNPTFSIVTFSIRLADHLAQELAGAKPMCS